MKKVMALVISAILLISMGTQAMAFESFGEAVTENLPTSFSGGKYAQASKMLVENDNYIVTVAGYDNVTYGRYYDDHITVFNKADGTQKEIISMASAKTDGLTCPVRNIWIDGNVLYVSYGNAVWSASTAYRATGNVESPLVAYDLRDTTKKVTIASGNAYGSAHYPYVFGGISYLDETNGKIYASKVTNGSYSFRTYNVINTQDVEAKLADSTAELTSAEFTTSVADGISKNAVKFIVKDGFLFEVLHNRAGVYENYYGTKNTLLDANGSVMNNTVCIYNLNQGIPSGGNVGSLLCGTYTTQTSGNAVINDIEVVGDYMYLATTEGIEVVSIAPAKAATDTAATLPAVTPVKEANYGGVLDLEVKDGFIYAALDKDTADGAVAVYNIKSNPASPALIESKTVSGVGAKDISVDEDTIYVLKKGTPAVTAFNYTAATPVVTNIDAVTFGGAASVAAGTGDVKVQLTTDKTGIVICAVYEGDTLSDVLTAPYNGSGSEITVAGAYTVGANVTRINAMFWSDINNQLIPLCSSKDISK